MSILSDRPEHNPTKEGRIFEGGRTKGYQGGKVGPRPPKDIAPITPPATRDNAKQGSNTKS